MRFHLRHLSTFTAFSATDGALLLNLLFYFRLYSPYQNEADKKLLCVRPFVLSAFLRWLLSSGRWVSATNITQALWRVGIRFQCAFVPFFGPNQGAAPAPLPPIVLRTFPSLWSEAHELAHLRGLSWEMVAVT